MGFSLKVGVSGFLCDLCKEETACHKIYIDIDVELKSMSPDWKGMTQEQKLFWLTDRNLEYVLVGPECGGKLELEDSMIELQCPSLNIGEDNNGKMRRECDILNGLGMDHKHGPPCSQCFRARLRKSVGIPDNSSWWEWYKERCIGLSSDELVFITKDGKELRLP